jgi:glucose-1-phosphatase
MAIKNIIFDLGGIFIDVDYAKTRQAFIDLGIHNIDDYYQQSYSNPLFAALEKGLITPLEFYQQFRAATNTQLSNLQIATAWNAMLGQFRPTSIALLPKLSSQYQLYLLSNTNAIHYEGIISIYNHQFGNANFDAFFNKAYYSHLYHERKPDASAYQTILTQNALNSYETLFVDDTPKNIHGATAVGIKTLLVPNNTLVEDLIFAALEG